MNSVPEVTPETLSEEIKSGKSLYLLDVREADELKVSVLEGVHHVPLGDLQARCAEIPQDSDIVVICRSGMRSARATEFLLSQGYASVRNMTSGMNGWATKVDTSLQVY
jgi:sulfur-carrier protein adenylyltransferase/sulfurtransferase